MAEQELTEIALTSDNGFVIKKTGEPVEILGGDNTLGRVVKFNHPCAVEIGVEDAIRRVFAHSLPEGINGYIIHTKTPLGQVSDRIPKAEWEYMVAFSAVKYRKTRSDG